MNLNHAKVIGVEPFGDTSLDCLEFKFLCFQKEPSIKDISEEEYTECLKKAI